MSTENSNGFCREPLDFSLEFSRHDRHVAVVVHGELDASTAPTLRERLSDLIECQGNLSVVVDLAATTFIDSTGLSVLVTAHKWLRARGGELRLAGPRRSTAKVLEITGLSRILTVVPS